jgi:type II secretory pathway predicted ATPase ExeA
MDYVARYGMDFNPFIKNSVDTLVETHGYNEAIYRLNHLLSTKGFGVITAGAGRGKTTAIRHWVKSVNTSLYKVVYISLSTTTTLEFYKQLALGLGLEPHYRKSYNYRAIQAEITRYSLEKNMTVIIVIDEANYIQSGILNDLKMLFNFEMDSKDRAIVILTGLPILNNTLQKTTHEPLKQRITMNYHLEDLSETDGRLYIDKRLQAAKCNQTVFEDSAILAILNAANGTPRLINRICDKCLLIGHVNQANIINSDIVMQAIDEAELRWD